MVSTQNDRIYAYYVGETISLAGRIHQYICPGKQQRTNVQLKAYFDQAASQGRRVEVQKLALEPFQLNQERATTLSSNEPPDGSKRAGTT
jgi:hypothetical protein